jgi:xylose isomerase
MQAQPWYGLDTFTPDDLIQSAIDYRQEPLQVVLLWGVAMWVTDPRWMSAGARALDILQSS